MRRDPALLSPEEWGFIWSIIGRHVPLRRGKDYLWVSPEFAARVPDDLRLGTMVDTRLRGMEMRLERPCR
jgi:hypothetical protein